MENNKSKKVLLIMFLIFIIVPLILVFIIKIYNENKEYKAINNIVDVVLNNTGNHMVYIGGEKCEDCSMQSYQMKLFLSEYDLGYYYISLDSVSKFHANNILEKLGLDTESVLPTIAIYNDGNIKVSQSGLVGTNSLYNLFKDNNLISEEPLKMNYLTISSYVDKVNESNVILALGSMKSEQSLLFEEYLWGISSEYNVDINFLYISNLNKLEGNLFESKLKNFNEYNLEIPSLLIVDNGVIRAASTGLKETKEYVEFLQENDIIE